MLFFNKIFFFLFNMLVCNDVCYSKTSKITDINIAERFLKDFDSGAQAVYYKLVVSLWNYNTNLTEHNQKISVQASLERSEYMKSAAENTSRFAWESFENEYIRRQFKKISDTGTSILSETDLKRYEVIQGDLDALYSKAKVCNKPGDTTGKCYPLEPDLTNILITSNDLDVLKWAWQGWRDVSGKKMKNQYVEMVGILNKAALLLGENNAKDWWQSTYEDANFEGEIERLWKQVKPLYQLLHAHVRTHLQKEYGREYEFPKSGHIPAHMLGNMWAQQWFDLPRTTLPYPDMEFLDVTEAMKEQNYTAMKMFETADDFFISLGLDPMPAPFWEHSMFEKPEDGRDVVCHASAWDFYNRKDFRIKMCTRITTEDLSTIHHEMGHIQYYLQYKHLPVKFRRGGNAGFHEAIGDVISLSVTTPTHMHKIGLLKTLVENSAYDLNYLMSMALQKIAFLPFGYLVDQWRWSVFDGETKPHQYNKKWWQLRCNLQGLSPPVQRSEEDFDAASKYHIAGNTPYIRYFVSFIIQFQFHKSLCESAGHTGPLHKCDIYNSQEAGRKLKKMMRLGSSQPWQDAMELLTGQREMDAGPLIEYFQPIIDWLRDENKGAIGWDETGCPPGSYTSHGSYGVDRNILKTIITTLVSFILLMLKLSH